MRNGTLSRRSTFRCLLLIPLAAVGALGTACRAPSRDPAPRAPAGDYVIGVSPFIPQKKVAAVRSTLYRLILDKVSVGSHIAVFDAYHLSRITDLLIPQDDAFNSIKIRTRKFARNLGEIQRFLDASAGAAGEGEADGRIRWPEFLDLVANSRRGNSTPATVVLLGGPLYLDTKDARFSMTDGRYPSDDHLCVGRAESVFGVADRGAQLTRARVLLGYLVDPWVNGLHEEPVRRFWSLFIAAQGGELIAFAGDLPTVVDSLGDPASPSPWSYELHCPPNPQPAMIVGPLPPPPGPIQAALRIGIRWSCLHCDLDLYSRPSAGAAELFYRNQKTAEGVYLKDYLTSPMPANDFEWIEYRKPVDLSKVEAAVNFYAGHSPGGVPGEVLVQSGGASYLGKFRIEAEEGNQGGEREQRASSPNWTVLKIGALVGAAGNRQSTVRVTTGPGRSTGPMPPAGPTPPVFPGWPPSDDWRGVPPEPRTSGPARRVRILSPRDGSTIRVPAGISGPVQHPVEGDVLGYGQAAIGRLHLIVEVQIYTNQWFPEGIAEVRGDGTWRVQTAHFGGSHHIVQATLKDGNGNEIDTQEVTVTVVNN